jgi:hypothetical protein
MYLQNKPLFLINIFVLYLYRYDLLKIYYSFNSIKFYVIENKNMDSKLEVNCIYNGNR